MNVDANAIPQPEQQLQDQLARLPHHIPDDRRHCPPLPEQQKQHQTRQHNIGAALDGVGHKSRPPAFERWSCHHTVLQTKQANQQHVDHGRVPNGRRDTAVDAARNRNVAHKTDGVNKSRKAQKIAGCAVADGKDAFHREPAGWMFWLMWNTLSGSYCALISLSRW
jgi:hypothetical protein